MLENKITPVKCASCDKFFGYADDNKNCPFCNTPYGKAEEEVKEAKLKVKKIPVKTQKDSFKIWRDN